VIEAGSGEESAAAAETLTHAIRRVVVNLRKNLSAFCMKPRIAPRLTESHYHSVKAIDYHHRRSFLRWAEGCAANLGDSKIPESIFGNVGWKIAKLGNFALPKKDAHNIRVVLSGTCERARNGWIIASSLDVKGALPHVDP
jgi:hypothetical protein